MTKEIKKIRKRLKNLEKKTGQTCYLILGTNKIILEVGESEVLRFDSVEGLEFYVDRKKGSKSEERLRECYEEYGFQLS